MTVESTDIDVDIVAFDVRVRTFRPFGVDFDTLAFPETIGVFPRLGRRCQLEEF